MKTRYIFSAVAILIMTVFVVIGCSSSSSSSSSSDDNGSVGTEADDSNWGTPRRQSRPGVWDTMKFSFLIAGDPQPDVTHMINHDTPKIRRIRATVDKMNDYCSDVNCIGAILVGDLTEKSCSQEVIAFRQMFEDSYPGYDGGSILGVTDSHYEWYSDGSKFIKAVFPLIGNHDDPTHGHDLCDWDATCSERADKHCHSTFVQDYIRARIRGSGSLYEVSKLLNSDGVNYYSYDTGDIYAWEWGSYHFINTGIWAGFQGAASKETDTGKLNQLKEYLEMNIGDSGKPVLIFQHYGWTGWNFNDNWWTRESAADLINVFCRRENTEDTCNPYNVIGIFSGHIHETAYRSIYAGTDKDNNPVTFDNYLVNDCGPAACGDCSTGFFKVELEYKANSLGHMTVWEYRYPWDGIVPTFSIYGEKEFNLPLIDWEQGEPNNAGGIESCAEVGSKGRFYDLDCSQLRRIACRYRDSGELLFSGSKFTWPEAQAACDKEGMDFARLTTSAEQREFIDLYKKSADQTEMVWVNARSPWVFKVDAPINIGDIGDDTEGAGITMADIDGNGIDDLITLHIKDENNDDGLSNSAHYSIHFNPNKNGAAAAVGIYNFNGAGTGYTNQGAGITAGLINDNNITDLVVFVINHYSGMSRGYYSIGWDIDKTTGMVASWSDWINIPNAMDSNEYFFTDSSAGGGVAIGDIDNNGIPDLLFYNISAFSGGLNKGKFFIARDISSTTGVMTNVAIIPWYGVDYPITSINNLGGGVSLADIDGNGQLDVISYFIEDRGNSNPNYAYYDIGWNPSLVGSKYQPTSWTRHRANTDVGNITRYGGIVIGDIDGSGRPDLVVASVMGAHPNKFRYAVARNLNKEGNLVTQHLDENGTLVPGN